jgi:GDP-4-dehydro-6-deoxy-D-mannose reductase
MRILVTGANGFVGRHLLRALPHNIPRDSVILATARHTVTDPEFGPVEGFDVADTAAAETTIRRFMPTHVIHLAGIASPSQFGCDAFDIWTINTLGTLKVAHAVQRHAPRCWLLFIGSGLVYGDSGKSGRPLREDAILAPTNDYAVTKAAADLALGSLAAQGLKVLRLRAFNHTGPGQDEAYVVPGFAAQVARIEAGMQPPVIRVGNLDAERDFLDVRDVVSAYIKAALTADELGPGSILNIASGIPWRIRAILDELLARSSAPISVEQDPLRMRPSDTPRYVGDAQAARKALGWHPVHDFRATLSDILAYWRATVREGRG